jgi:hypothetical protein
MVQEIVAEGARHVDVHRELDFAVSARGLDDLVEVLDVFYDVGRRHVDFCSTS